MKKILLLLTILISLNVLADWIFVITNTSNDYFYIDPQTIAKEGNKVRFWTKTNYNNLNTGGSRSVRSYDEIDCKKRTIMTLSISAFSELDFEGNTIASFKPPSDIEYIAPDTVNDGLLKYVCK